MCTRVIGVNSEINFTLSELQSPVTITSSVDSNINIFRLENIELMSSTLTLNLYAGLLLAIDIMLFGVFSMNYHRLPL